MNKPSNELFDLIHSLSPSEKRYFSLTESVHSKIRGEHLYLQLFDAINKQKTYNETELKKKLSQGTLGKQFAVIKNQLYELILKALTAYHSGNSTNMQLNEGMLQVEVLFNHGLYDRCFKLIDKLKAIADETGKDLAHVQLLVWERKLFLLTTIRHDDPGYLNKINEQMLEMRKRVSNSIEYIELIKAYSSLHLEFGMIPNAQELKSINELLEHPLLKFDEEALSLPSKLTQLQVRAMFNEAIGNYKESLNDSLKLLDLFNSGKFPINDEPQFFIIFLNDLFQMQLKLEMYEAAGETLKLFDELEKNVHHQRLNGMLRATIFGYRLSARLRYAHLKKEIADIKKLEELLSTGLTEHQGTLGYFVVLDLHYNMARLFFSVAEYDKALKWLKPLLDTSPSQAKKDILGMARILEIIIHYEEGQFGLLEYLLRSAERFFGDEGFGLQVEVELVHTLKKVISAKTAAKRTELFKDLNTRFTALFKKESEKKALDFFEFDEWVAKKSASHN